MWIKICGITSLEDANFAIAAGADAIGFVFAESPRRITPQDARAIIDKLPQHIEKIGVFVSPFLDELAAIHHSAGLTGLQLHDSTLSTKAVRSRIDSPAIRIVHVVRYQNNADHFARDLKNLEPLSDAVLIDTCIPGKQGGTGIPFDWSAARESFLQHVGHLRLIAAGGLRPENIRQAILTLAPWGVDVSSGVEAAPGKKDPARVAAFIREAHAAADKLAADELAVVELGNPPRV